MEGQRVLVMGATGMIGSHLAKELAKTNTVYGAGLFKERTCDSVAQHQIIPIPLDVTQDDFDVLPGEVDYVFVEVMFHGPDDYARSMQVNAFTTARLLERYPDCKGVVLGSTGSVYRYITTPADEHTPLEGLGAYGVSKICSDVFAEYFSRYHGTPVCVLRYYGPYCETGGSVKWWLDAVVRQEPVRWPDLRLAPLYMSDVVAMTIRAADCCTSPPTIINVAADEIVPRRHVVEMIAAHLGREPLFGDANPRGPIVVAADNVKRRALLGEQTVSLVEGVRRVCAAYLATQDGR